MNVIGWIIRILAILLVVRLVMRFLGGVITGYAGQGPSRKPNQPATRQGGHLVRDPNCGTYVAMGRALREGSGDHAVYFCSETCRNAWAARKTG